MGREIFDVMKDMKDVFEMFSSGQVENIDWEKFKPFYTVMSNEIKYQHERVGGDFVVAQAVTSRDMRDHIRKQIPNCIFVTLTMTKETQLKRVTARHGKEGADAIIEFLSKIYNLYEGPGEGEKNTYNIDITAEMTREDVKQKVLELLASLEVKKKEAKKEEARKEESNPGAKKEDSKSLLAFKSDLQEDSSGCCSII